MGAQSSPLPLLSQKLVDVFEIQVVVLLRLLQKQKNIVAAQAVGVEHMHHIKCVDSRRLHKCTQGPVLKQTGGEIVHTQPLLQFAELGLVPMPTLFQF